MSFLRPLIALAVVALPIWVSGNYAEHHSSDNVFSGLFMHLMPATLVSHGAEAGDGHGAPGAGEEHAEPGHDHAAEALGHDDEQAAAGAQHGAGSPLISLPMPAALAALDGDPGHAGAQLVFTNLQLFQIAAVLLIFICFMGVPKYLRTGRGDYLTRLFAGFAMWVRDDMVLPVMGKERGLAFLPFFLSMFFFILFMNLMGLVPGSATATASIFVTCGLALITLTVMIGGGMIAQGPIAFWKNLVPHVPAGLWPLLFVVEIVGLFIKPFALMIRLFANMSGGHMVVLSFMGLIFLFGGRSLGVGYAISPAAVGFSVFIMIIESFVAMVQAFIFTQLSIIFINAAIHPEH